MFRVMPYEMYKLYRDILRYGSKYKLGKLYNNMYHFYWHRDNGSIDGIPCVIKPSTISFKECSCCQWKPAEIYGEELWANLR